MCNYPEQPIKNIDNLIIPINDDRKSKLVSVFNFASEEEFFELYLTGKKSYITKYLLVNFQESAYMYDPRNNYAIGDIINFQEISDITKEFTGRIFTVIITYIEKIINNSIISFKPIKD